MAAKISVIVPVYNVEQYIARCVESILNQSYTDLELILVDDGSVDSSGEICRKYALKDPRVVVISQENQGVSAARNRGLEAAGGEWIGFVDADDFLDADFYETLYSGASLNKAEIICCGVRAVDETGAEQRHLLTNDIPDAPVFLSQEEALIHFLHPGKRYLYWSPWDKLIRGDVARKHRFEVGRKLAEDFFFCFQCILDSHGVCYIPGKKYNYMIRSDSATQSRIVTPSSFDSTYFAQKAWEMCISRGLPQCVVTCADMNRLVVNARATRSYYRAKGYRDKARCRELTKVCRKTLKDAAAPTKKTLSRRFKTLLMEAAYFPLLFYVR